MKATSYSVLMGNRVGTFPKGAG